MMNFRFKFAKDEGLTIAEILIGLSISGLLMVGVSTFFDVSTKSIDGALVESGKGVNELRLQRTIVADAKKSQAFTVFAANSSASPVMCSSKQQTPSVIALVTFDLGSVGLVGYEVRTTAGSSEIWRVACSSGAIIQTSFALRSGLPVLSANDWASRITCANPDATSALTFEPCPTDTPQTRPNGLKGFRIDMPATISGSPAIPQQIITAARSY